MWKKWKTYSKISLLVLLTLLSIVILLVASKKEYSTVEAKEKIKESKKIKSSLQGESTINYLRFKEKILDVENFNDRETLTKSEENKVKLLIGNSKKELENNFYDIKIEVDNGIDIYINKLWKTKLNSNFCEEEYVSEVVDLLNECFYLNLDLAYKNKLKQSIMDNYIRIKKSLLDNKIPNIVNLQLDNVNFIYSEDKGRLRLKIEFVK